MLALESLVANFPPVLTWPQACEVLGCSRSFFYLLVKKGLLPTVSPRRGGARVRKADCLAYLMERDKRCRAARGLPLKGELPRPSAE